MRKTDNPNGRPEGAPLLRPASLPGIKQHTAKLLKTVMLLLATVSAQAKIYWPVQGQPIPRNKPVETVIQATSSGNPESGLFGCVRNNGYKFHEGLDIKSQKRDRYSRPMDKVVAVMPGKVAYVNKVGGKSSYGVYVILEHTEEKPKVYSLYAHLASVEKGITAGKPVAGGQVLGIMGHTASTGIPRSRAHLHFEIGLRLTDNFQTWYNQQKFTSKNDHGVWNGMNMVGLDVLDFFRKAADGKITGMQDYFRTVPEAFSLRIRTSKTPDFIRRYPGLLTSPAPSIPAGWDITWTWYGMPLQVTPLYPKTTPDGPDIQVLKINKTLMTLKHCRATLTQTGDEVKLGEHLKHNLSLIFDY
jgi:murein DD-endopeptidase MepM/ murein hydrolase activator NlpD